MRLGRSGRAGHGEARPGKAWQARQEWQGVARPGRVRLGEARHGRHGRHGSPGAARLGGARHGLARRAEAGEAWRGEAGEAWLGVAWPGSAGMVPGAKVVEDEQYGLWSKCVGGA